MAEAIRRRRKGKGILEKISIQKTFSRKGREQVMEGAIKYREVILETENNYIHKNRLNNNKNGKILNEHPAATFKIIGTP